LLALAAIALLAALGAGFMVWRIGPRNVIGMLLYDQRREGTVKVGDAAPDVELHRLDAGTERLSAWIGGRPLVLVFGSFT
jgi:hypothetical protein